MRKTIPFLILALSAFTACGDTNDNGDEEAAATQVSGKSDSLFDEIVFGSYENPDSEPGELASLELIRADKSELTEAHYEGLFTLTEHTRDGMKTAEGEFNVYRFRGENWIRFVKDDGKFATASEKFAWSVEGDVMRMETTVGTQFKLSLVEDAVVFDCGFGVEGSEFLPFDVSDPYGRTVAELMETISIENFETADRFMVEIVTNAANAEGLSIEEYLETFDDNEVGVYDLTWFTTAFEMVRGHQGDTEVGVIFDAGFGDPIAQISDGEIIGCNRDGECNADVRHSFPETTAPFHEEPLTTEIGFIDSSDKMTELMEAQLRIGLTQNFEELGDASAEELLEFTDDDGFTYYEGEKIQWVQWFGGDNEVGAFFEKDTLNLVGTVGDGDVSACIVAE